MAKLNKNIKVSDKFWKENLMRVLECLEYQEMTWARDHWQEYGISNSDAKKIESEYARYASRPSN
jgi:hypothetical protein